MMHQVLQAEDELCKALSVSIVGDTAAPPVDALAVELARRYEHSVESLEFHRLEQGNFPVLLPD
jgi:hypothetical protein